MIKLMISQAAFDSHNKANPPKPNMYTLHRSDHQLYLTLFKIQWLLPQLDWAFGSPALRVPMGSRLRCVPLSQVLARDQSTHPSIPSGARSNMQLYAIFDPDLTNRLSWSVFWFCHPRPGCGRCLHGPPREDDLVKHGRGERDILHFYIMRKIQLSFFSQLNISISLFWSGVICWRQSIFENAICKPLMYWTSCSTWRRTRRPRSWTQPASSSSSSPWESPSSWASSPPTTSLELPRNNLDCS